MKQILLLPFVFFTLLSCKQEEKTSSADQVKDQQKILELEIELSELRRQLVEEQNLRLERESEQAALLADMKGLLKQVAETQEQDGVEIVAAPAVKRDDDREEEVKEARRLARLKAEGETFAHLVTLSGDEYHDLVINRVSDIGVVFRHREGVARVPFSALPEAWRERFYYDDEMALLALKNERIMRARHERDAEARLAAMETKNQSEENALKLADLTQAVDNLKRPEPVKVVESVRHEQIIVGPPIIVHRDPHQNKGTFHTKPIIRTPQNKIPTLKPQATQTLIPTRPTTRPTMKPSRPVPVRPSTQRPPSRPTPVRPNVQKPRPTAKPTPVRPSTSRAR